MSISIDPSVKAEVVKEINRKCPPGMPVTRVMWHAAYKVVRSRAIWDTIQWKQDNLRVKGV